MPGTPTIQVLEPGELFKEDGTVNPDSLKTWIGYVEQSFRELKEGETVEFPRYGFVRVDGPRQVRPGAQLTGWLLAACLPRQVTDWLPETTVLICRSKMTWAWAILLMTPKPYFVKFETPKEVSEAAYEVLRQASCSGKVRKGTNETHKGGRARPGQARGHRRGCPATGGRRAPAALVRREEESLRLRTRKGPDRSGDRDRRLHRSRRSP